MPANVEHSEGKVSSVDFDEIVTNPKSKRAVQIPPEADGTRLDPLSAHEEPSPNEAYESYPEVFGPDATGEHDGVFTVNEYESDDYVPPNPHADQPSPDESPSE